MKMPGKVIRHLAREAFELVDDAVQEFDSTFAAEEKMSKSQKDIRYKLTTALSVLVLLGGDD